MNKYELAVVVSAKIEDDERAQVIEKVKALVERFGGQISDVDEWGKKRLAYEIQKMKEAYSISSTSSLMLRLQAKSSREFALWTTLSDFYALDRMHKQEVEV